MVRAVGSPVKLYLACGMKRVPGYHHVDISSACNPDQAWDLMDMSKRWPWHGVSEILIEHYIEHIPHGPGGKDYFIRFFERCWHVLKPNGTMTVRFPWYSSIGAFSDPTHVRFITPMTFSYLSREWLKNRKIEHYDMDCDFEVVKIEGGMAAHVEPLPENERNHAVFTQWNASHEGTATLRAIK